MASPCTDSADCTGGDVCCVVAVGEAAEHVCAALPDRFARDDVVACRPDETSCQSLGLGSCYLETSPPGAHYANRS